MFGTFGHSLTPGLVAGTFQWWNGTKRFRMQARVGVPFSASIGVELAFLPENRY
jgi:hypothetical protein